MNEFDYKIIKEFLQLRDENKKLLEHIHGDCELCFFKNNIEFCKKACCYCAPKKKLCLDCWKWNGE